MMRLHKNDDDDDPDDGPDDDDLDECPECGRLIFDDMVRCPRCGHDLGLTGPGRSSQPGWVRVVALVLVTLMLYGVARQLLAILP